MSILDDLPGIIADAMGDLIFRDAVLTRDGPPTGPAYDPTPGTPQAWPCKAVEDEWSSSVRSGGLVASADRKILILADTLKGAVPQEGDRVTVQGQTFLIVSDGGSQPAVTSDPANATWTCRGRA